MQSGFNAAFVEAGRSGFPLGFNRYVSETLSLSPAFSLFAL